MFCIRNRGTEARRLPPLPPVQVFLFVGGGYGSHEFYAFKAKTGETAWKIHTSDDLPTAAVVRLYPGHFGTKTRRASVPTF
jgi:hypothetical protein